MNRYEARDRQNNVICLIEGEGLTLREADGYGLQRVPGFFRAVVLDEDDLGLVASWQERGLTEQQARIAATDRGWPVELMTVQVPGHEPGPVRPEEGIAEEAKRLRKAAKALSAAGQLEEAVRRTHPEFTDDQVRIYVTGR